MDFKEFVNEYKAWLTLIGGAATTALGWLLGRKKQNVDIKYKVKETELADAEIAEKAFRLKTKNKEYLNGLEIENLALKEGMGELRVQMDEIRDILKDVTEKYVNALVKITELESKVTVYETLIHK